MTEAEWLAESPGRMIAAVWERVTVRKQRLFCCALCRSVWDRLADDRCRQAVEVAERFEDGLASLDELDAARVAASRAGEPYRLAQRTVPGWIRAAVQTTARRPSPVTDDTLMRHKPGETPDSYRNRWRARNRALLLDLLGPLLFRKVRLQLDWRVDAAVVALASGMYQSRDFSAMPILADALQDAGCDDADILNHCRGDGPHVRGCWVVDLVLGKS